MIDIGCAARAASTSVKKLPPQSLAGKSLKFEMLVLLSARVSGGFGEKKAEEAQLGKEKG